MMQTNFVSQWVKEFDGLIDQFKLQRISPYLVTSQNAPEVVLERVNNWKNGLISLLLISEPVIDGKKHKKAMKMIMQETEYLVIDEVHDLSDAATKFIKANLRTKYILGLTATAYINELEFSKLLNFIGLPYESKLNYLLKKWEECQSDDLLNEIFPFLEELIYADDTNPALKVDTTHQIFVVNQELKEKLPEGKNAENIDAVLQVS
jgi:hypothetical protein